MSIPVKQSTETWLPVILTDDTDFKTPETGTLYSEVTVKYAKATDTSFTTKTMASGDWRELGEGVYEIKFSTTELNTIGLFKYVCYETGVLRYYGLADVATALRGDLDTDIAAIQADTDDIQARLPAALVGGRMSSDVGSISGDVAAADNLEATYDGTGYENLYAPAQQQQLDQIAITGAAINEPANANSVVITGSTVSGDYIETWKFDQVYWQIQDAAGVLEMYYEFLISADGVPTTVTFTGRVTGPNDDLDVFAWNWGASSWDQIGVLNGGAGTSDAAHTYNLFTSHVGTGANVGKVRIRFYGTGLTTANFYTDQIFLSYAVVYRSVGYADGAIWIDTINGTPGTTSYIHGTADNPVDSWANALTIASNLGLKRFRIIGGSSITLTANSDHYQIIGAEYDLALNGQSVANAYIEGANVSGTSAGLDCRYIDCRIGTVSLTRCGFGRCTLLSTVTLLSAGIYLFEGCFSSVAGVSTPFLDFGVAVGDTEVNFRHYSGGIELLNMGQSGDDKMSLEGDGQLIINANCVGGLAVIRGCFSCTDNSGGAVTLVDDARYSTQQVRDSMKLAPTAGSPGAGSVDEHLDSIDSLEDMHVAIETIVAVGSTSTEVRTLLTQTDDFFNNMIMVIREPGGAAAARNIDVYRQTNGAFTTFRALPFTPTVGQKVFILNRTGSLRDDSGPMTL